jgi:hypothetical protein
VHEQATGSQILLVQCFLPSPTCGSFCTLSIPLGSAGHAPSLSLSSSVSCMYVCMCPSVCLYVCICMCISVYMSYTRSQPARKDATNRNLLRQKLYCLHLQEQESKRARARALLLTSLGARVQESKSKRENGQTPSLLRRIILRLGHVTPWLAAAHRPSCRHGEGRAHGVENYPWHMCRLFVYHLEHRMSAPSCNGECEGGSPH